MSETGSRDRVTDELHQAYVPERGYDETDTVTIMSDLHSGNRRITYSKEFLVKCFQHPACSQKPAENPWPKPELECTTGTPRLKSPFLPYIKKENGRKEDNISLRPQSGNFSSGCAPNLSPAHFPSHNQYNRFSFQHQDEQPPPKTFFDRGMQKNNLRFNGNVRSDLNEKTLRDRDGRGGIRNDRGGDRGENIRGDRVENIRGDRVENIRGNRGENIRGNREQDHVREAGGGRHNNDRRLWGPDSEERERNDWTRRRTNHRDRDNNRDRDRPYHQRNHHTEDNMPDWFTGGPTSRHDTIELDGFGDDKRCDRRPRRVESNQSSDGGGGGAENSKSGTMSPVNNNNNNTNDDVKEEEVVKPKEPNQMDLILELLMDPENHSSGILPNGLFQVQEREEAQDISTPGSGSRFSRFFNRETTDTTVIPPNDTNSSTFAPVMPREAKQESRENEIKFESSENGDQMTNSSIIHNNNTVGNSINPFQAFFGGSKMSDDNSNESKSDVIKGMNLQLRQILLGGNAKEEPQIVKHEPQGRRYEPQIVKHEPQVPRYEPQVSKPEPQSIPPQQQQSQDMNAFKKLLEDLVIKGQSQPSSTNTTEAQDVNPMARLLGAGPSPPFNNFGGLNNSVVQPRPLQQQNVMAAPPMSVNHVPPHHPLARFVDQQSRDSMLQNQKRSSTPVPDMSFTPTSVMRKLTTSDQQLKSGASNMKEAMNASSLQFGALSSTHNSSPVFSNITNSAPNLPPPGPHPQSNPLATFMSQMGQNQPMHQHQHMQPHQQPPQNHPGIPNPLGMYQQRLPFPVMGPAGPAGMQMPIPVPMSQMSQYMMYQQQAPPLHQRK